MKASVDAITAIFKQYFELEAQKNCKLEDYIRANEASWKEVERQRVVLKSRPKKSFSPILWAFPFWRYVNHQWTLLPFSGQEDSIAFVFALLLNTKVITFHDSSHVSWKEFKVFENDRLIEHYKFGFECWTVIEGDWDIYIEDFEFYPGWLNYEHYFKSSVRPVTESNIRLAVSARKNDLHDRGFLDRCLKHYNAYIPIREETPYHYHGEWNLNYQKWDSVVEQMSIALVPSNWRYFDRKVPQQVI
ncbi:hypothetical protein IQ249_18250 [Lusitaniella coriacea LEGE 07157]|uniref:Uncharacterized protein n=1 Tax=Lusitaniella coriacea LEGE 07157 TaxID=945747 RepID=A0A8J7DZ28_9CYAN|nr:hypothetical protein [Lusitaniella coriacea]MBE9117845.1 hypothetical protein [Lusitaniella coriacea LEGE 07157]